MFFPRLPYLQRLPLHHYFKKLHDWRSYHRATSSASGSKPAAAVYHMKHAHGYACVVILLVIFSNDHILGKIRKFWMFQHDIALQWHHNERDGVSNHQRLDWLLNRLFRCRSKKKQSSATLAFVMGIHRWPVDSQHRGPATRKMFPFDDVIMILCNTRIFPTI